MDQRLTADTARTAPASRGLPAAVCAGWGAGSIGVSVLLNTVSIYFPTLMVTVLGQPAALAGALMTGSKLYDAVADISIGAISDRTRTRFGRRRPYLILGGVVGALALLMIFVLPHPAGAWLPVFFAAALVLYSTGYSLFNVPYIAMASEMSDGYHERTRLFAFRMFFVSVGQMASLSATAFLVGWGGGGAPGYAVMGAVMAAVTLASMFTAFVATAGLPTLAPAPRRREALRENFRSLWGNRALVLLMATKFLQYVAVAVLITSQLLFLLSAIRVGYAGQVNLGLASNIAGAVTIPIWPKLARRIGKKQTFLLATLLLAAACASWLLARVGEPMALIALRGAAIGVLSAGMIVMGTSMLTDTMELDRQVTGLRREGVFSSFYAITEKVGFAIGPAVVGAYLSAAGYVSSTGGRLVAQPESAVHALYACLGVVAPALLVAAALTLSFYRLDEAALKPR